jgi:hypothetical protein
VINVEARISRVTELFVRIAPGFLVLFHCRKKNEEKGLELSNKPMHLNEEIYLIGFRKVFSSRNNGYERTDLNPSWFQTLAF